MVLNKYIVTLIYLITSQLSIITIGIACNYHYSSYRSTPYSKFEDGDHNQDKTPYFFPINGRKVKLTSHSFQHQCPEHSFKLTVSSRSPFFLSLPSQKAVFDMCDFLDAIPPTNQPTSFFFFFPHPFHQSTRKQT